MSEDKVMTKTEMIRRAVEAMRVYLRRFNVDLDAICRETCRRVNGRLKRS